MHTGVRLAGCWQAWHNLGLGLLSLGDLDEAARTFRKAHGMKPDDPDVLFNLAHCLKEACPC